MGKEIKSKKRIIVAIILLVMWMAFIFIMSAMSGDESGALSSGIVHTLLKFIPPLSESEAAHIVIRKLAHMTEYAILCGLIINLEKSLGHKIGEKQILIAIAGSCIYAMTDEYHQTFVSERSGNLIDVGIDTIGSAIMAIIIYMITIIKNKKSSI